MSWFLGLDTSNYTTSSALYNPQTGECIPCKLMLPVKDGQKGLRQSDAVFGHIKQLSEVIGELFEKNRIEMCDLTGIGVSVKPRNAEGSYMPCFLCGETVADILGTVIGKNVYKTSHQMGHMLAALYSADCMDYINDRFMLFHVSGGTTECLICMPNKDNLVDFQLVATSLDLKAGQLIDRTGVMLGMKFPCGKELEKLSEKSSKKYKIKPVFKGTDCCLSGVENLCMNMHNNGDEPCDIAKYVLSYVGETIIKMTNLVSQKYGDMPLVYAGGVMSDSFIRDGITKYFPSAKFAKPEYSCDNAAGTAIYASIMSKYKME